MSLSVSVCALWALATTAVAMLPLRCQYAPGLVLLALAPALILWLGHDHGWFWSLAAMLGFLSMFRHPLRYFLCRGAERLRNPGTSP